MRDVMTVTRYFRHSNALSLAGWFANLSFVWFFPNFNPNDIIVLDSIGKQIKREYMHCECVCFRGVVSRREEIRVNMRGAKRSIRTHCILAFCDLHASLLNTTASEWLCKRIVLWLQFAFDKEICEYSRALNWMALQREKGEMRRTVCGVDSTNANWFNKCTQTQTQR